MLRISRPFEDRLGSLRRTNANRGAAQFGPNPLREIHSDAFGGAAGFLGVVDADEAPSDDEVAAGALDDSPPALPDDALLPADSDAPEAELPSDGLGSAVAPCFDSDVLLEWAFWSFFPSLP